MTKTLKITHLAASLRYFKTQGGGKVPFQANDGLKTAASDSKHNGMAEVK